jgi:hypothetical protein
MNTGLPQWGVAALAAALIGGCASIKADDVKIYSPAQLQKGQYETVARLWVESWRANFWTPTYSSPADGISGLKDKAASLGANGLTNVDCYNNHGPTLLSWAMDSAYTCYGKAIRVP